MRPINKRDTPLTPAGEPIDIKIYQQARGHLIRVMGSYCSYCERYLGGNIAVEHIKPKSTNATLELTWDNFLLACNNCNSIKGDNEIILTDYFWPDKDNTSLVFNYSEGGIISTASELVSSHQLIALNTIKLTGLDRIPSDDPHINPEMKDRRWSERKTAYEKAQRARSRLEANNHEGMRSQIVDTATSTGFYSIWMTVFSEDQNMLKRFIEAFPGTDSNCYDEFCVSIRRSGGAI